MSNNYNYELRPGRNLNKVVLPINNQEPIISIITPYYNGEEYIQETINSVLNQTFPYWEWIIVDDGSPDKKSVEKLEELVKIDDRIKVYYKKNGGPASARDFAVEKANKNSKYLFFLDADDQPIRTYFEIAYWTLETNTDAAWAYTGVVNFDGQEFLWSRWFDSNLEKKDNLLGIMALIRKQDFLEVNGFELREKSVYEDWNLWLKLIAKGKYPVKINEYGFWYRIKAAEKSELGRSQGQNNERAMEIINKTALSVKEDVEAIQYPFENFDWDLIPEKVDNIVIPKYKKTNKIKILMIIPWMTMGGADKFNLDLLKGLDKEKFEVILITTVPHENPWRQEFEKEVKAIYDLTAFLDKKYWIAFLNYIIEKENIDLIFNTNSLVGYGMIPYLKAKHYEIPIIDYIHMEEWYYRNGGYSRDSAAVASCIDKTYVCNKNSERILSEYFGKPKDEVETIYIGVDEKKFDPDKYDKKEIYKKYNIDEEFVKNKKVITYIARIDLQKRPHLLMKVIKKLSQKRDDFVFLVVGNGPMLKDIIVEAKKFKISDKIKFLGAVKNTYEIYKISDITLNCSIKEGLALTAYESLSMGVPAVSADVGGQRELITAETGVIVPCLQEENEIRDFNYKLEEINSYVDGLEKVLDNLDYYKLNCRNKILNGFTINQMIENMSRIFENTAKHPNINKIEIGKGLNKCIDVTKDYLVRTFMEDKVNYEWGSNEYNCNKYGLIILNAKHVAKRNKLKEKLWNIRLYRGIVKFFQKTGITKLIKKLLKRG